MRTVRLVEGRSRWPYGRQTPNGDGVFGQTQFLFDDTETQADWLVVVNEVPDDRQLLYPRARTIFFSGEPPAVRPFDPAYLDQFGTVITVDRGYGAPSVRYEAPLVCWHVGIRPREPAFYGEALSFAEIEQAPVKTKLCSCISSTLSHTEGHAVRLAFLERLRAELGNRIDFFGRGIREITDKDQALAPYRFTIAIENCVVPDYWTEKLADGFLRNCFPLYHGAPNVADYFDPLAVQAIDISDPSAAIATIAKILDSDIDRRRADIIARAKQRVMLEHNVLARIDRLIDEAERARLPPGESRRILPEQLFQIARFPRYRRTSERLVHAVRSAGRRARRLLKLSREDSSRRHR